MIRKTFYVVWFFVCFCYRLNYIITVWRVLATVYKWYIFLMGYIFIQQTFYVTSYIVRGVYDFCYSFFCYNFIHFYYRILSQVMTFQGRIELTDRLINRLLKWYRGGSFLATLKVVFGKCLIRILNSVYLFLVGFVIKKPYSITYQLIRWLHKKFFHSSVIEKKTSNL